MYDNIKNNICERCDQNTAQFPSKVSAYQISVQDSVFLAYESCYYNAPSSTAWYKGFLLVQKWDGSLCYQKWLVSNVPHLSFLSSLSITLLTLEDLKCYFALDCISIYIYAKKTTLYAKSNCAGLNSKCKTNFSASFQLFFKSC